jgi:RNA polymerase sigma-70 factor (ECF subfamily)
MTNEFETLVQQESQKLYGFCFRLTGNSHEAEDLCQEALARAWKNYHAFEGRSQLSTWIIRIAINAWKNNLRRKKGKSFLGFLSLMKSNDSDEEQVYDPPGSEPAPDTNLEKSQSQEILQEGLMSLTAEEREIIVLRDLEERSYEEVADLLNIPMGTMKSRLSRAREALRLKLIPILRTKGEMA